MRYAAKVDANQHEIVRALEQIPGVLVLSLSSVGKGVPDLLVQVWRNLVLMEIKDGSKVPSKRKLRKLQQDFVNKGWRVTKVESVDEALAAIGLTNANQ